MLGGEDGLLQLSVHDFGTDAGVAVSSTRFDGAVTCMALFKHGNTNRVIGEKSSSGVTSASVVAAAMNTTERFYIFVASHSNITCQSHTNI